jgi:hypothetical protein
MGHLQPLVKEPAMNATFSFHRSITVLALALPSLAAVAAPETPTLCERLACADPVVQSFERMLAHQPSMHTPALPAQAHADPLIDAVARPLLRSTRVKSTRLECRERR